MTWKRFLLLSILASIVVAGWAVAAPPPVIGTNQRTLVICVRYTDALTPRMTNCSDWVTLLNNETDTFYNRATFNQTNFQFETISGAGAPATGWLDLSYTAAANPGFWGVAQDAITLADPYANFANYDRVLVITSWPDFGGSGGGPWWWAVSEGAEATVTPAAGGSATPSRLMTLAIVNEWLANSFGLPFDEAGSVMAHELGHQLALPTHYGSILVGGAWRDTITPWDIMGLSPSYNHFIGYAKTNRGWIPAGPRIVTVGPPTTVTLDQTITLRPLEQTTASPQVIRIPLAAGAPFIGYVVENRRQINGDEQLPSQGVLLSGVNESTNSILRAIVMEDPSEPLNLDLAPLEVGEAFTDPSHGLTVTVLSQSGDNYDVRVQYGPPTTTFDPAIVPWGAPPWETADIWIDSQRNTYGTYAYTDAGGNPVGNGDDAWVDHDNRVYARVHNYGTGAATNVRVQVYSNSPPGMGDAGPGWDYLGTILIPTIAASGQETGYLTWKPTVAAHTCIKAVIVDTPGELLTANNLAQENVTHFDTSPGSPFDPVVLQSVVHNPFDVELPIRIHVADVPYGWAVVTDPPQMTLPPKGQHRVHVAVYPSGLPAHEPDGQPSAGTGTSRVPCPPVVKWDPKRLRESMAIGFVGKPKVEAQMVFYDTWVAIGGIDVWTHLTRATDLTCNFDGKPQPDERTGELVRRALEQPVPRDREAAAKPKKEQRKRPIPEKRRPALDPDTIAELVPLVLTPEAEPWFPPGPVTVEGQITPAIAGAVLAVEVKTGERSEIEFVKTDEAGRYRYVTQRGLTGRVAVQVFFDGDRTHAEAESGICAFNVKR
ncbi:MAG: hypothetical protein HY825_19620 [Acidobacteria bacterium]|nr:hypothetical protein [Acidobacteriota bacterium]